jgi:hypothetical protein
MTETPTKKKRLSELTGKDLGDGLDKLKKDDLIFRLDFEQIAKHFLNDHLPLAVFKTDFRTFWESYLAETAVQREKTQSSLFRQLGIEQVDKVPEVPQEFYKYICKKYFDLVREPMRELVNSYAQTTSDMREIDQTLANITGRLKEIYERNDPAEIQEMNPILHYYKDHNERARAVVLKFLLHKVKDHALSASLDQRFLNSFMGYSTYNYSWNAQSYTPKMPDDLANKFGLLPYPDYRELQELYHKDKSAFASYLLEYIEQEEVVWSINNKISHHHILSGKRELITEVLNAYANGSKLMFASAVPTIIEGILHELCLLVGISEHDLMQPKRGFQYKLDVLNDKLGIELNYEYYSFRFRIFRNKVAHGRLTIEDAHEIADMLLLDLRHICELVFSMKLPVNQKRFVIEELFKNLQQPDYNKLIEYVFRYKEFIPEFYDLTQQQAAVDQLILSDGFWDFILEKIQSEGESWRHALVKMAGILNVIAPDKKWKQIYKKTGLNKAKKEYVDELLKYLHDPY